MEQLELSYTAGGNVKFQSLWKTLSQLLVKFNINLPRDPEISLLGIYPREMDTYVSSYKDLYRDSYSSFIHNSQNLELSQISIIKIMDKTQCGVFV